MTTNTYQQQNLGDNLSQVVLFDDQQDKTVRSFERGPDQPTIRLAGMLWCCTDATRLGTLGLSGVTEAFLRWNGTAWTVQGVAVSSAGAAQWVDSRGKTAMAADLAMGGHKITGATAATAPGGVVILDQVILANGSNDFTADQSMGDNRLKDLGAPEAPNDAMRLADLPAYLSQMWWQTNYDSLANGKPVKWVDAADEDASFTEVGFVPRRLRLRLTGEFRRQSDNSLWGDIAVDGLEIDVSRWNSVAAGGDAGNDSGYFLVATIDSPSTARKAFVYIKWKFAEGPAGYVGPLGFYMKLTSGVVSGLPSDVPLKLGKVGSTSAAGVAQAMAWYGRGI